MKPKTIGIVGGAGPLAGVALLERLFRYAQVEYGCFQDADFPKVILVNVPFSDMLSDQINEDRVVSELKEALSFLKMSGAELLAIACNTLHSFLNEEMRENLVDLPQTTLSEVKRLGTRSPMILCTSTSRKSKLYDSLFPCSYPDLETQKRVDEIILSILKGDPLASSRLSSLIDELAAETVVLGCTELSLSFSSKQVIDPLEILAQQLIKKSFS